MTGDDVLIEYVSRIIKALRQKEECADGEDKSAIDRFVTHYVWHTADLNKSEHKYLLASLT